MKTVLPKRWFWFSILFVALLTASSLFLIVLLRGNAMHSPLDTLAALPFGERWAHPEMLKIRSMGTKAVPALCRVLWEKDSRRTRFLFWLEGKLPGAKDWVPDFPDLTKLSERRRTACQVLRSLGPAAQEAGPDLARIVASGDLSAMNSASAALHFIGITPETASVLVNSVQPGLTETAHSHVLYLLAKSSPPSSNTVRVFADALKHRSDIIQAQAAESIGKLGISSPDILASLRYLRTNATDKRVLLNSCSALWELEKENTDILEAVFKLLEGEVQDYSVFAPDDSPGGQGVSATEMLFRAGVSFLARVSDTDEERARALRILERFCNKSGRIFVQMILLPDMMKLGFAPEKGLKVCRTGLFDYTEDYYRIQAARLLAELSEKHAVEAIDLNELLRDKFLGVRVYAARAHWFRRKNPEPVIRILVESLDRSKHQSFHYSEILRVALQTLGEIGPAAESARSVVVKLKGDPDPTVAKLAGETLQRISP